VSCRVFGRNPAAYAAGSPGYSRISHSSSSSLKHCWPERKLGVGESRLSSTPLPPNRTKGFGGSLSLLRERFFALAQHFFCLLQGFRKMQLREDRNRSSRMAQSLLRTPLSNKCLGQSPVRTADIVTAMQGFCQGQRLARKRFSGEP